MSAARDNPPQRHTTSARTPVIADADTTAQRQPAGRSSRTAVRAIRRYHDRNHNGTAVGDGDVSTTSNPDGRPEHEGVNAYQADDSETVTVIVQPRDFRLPDVLRHIEAGKIVLVIPQHHRPD